jgi:hypothetical protein
MVSPFSVSVRKSSSDKNLSSNSPVMLLQSASFDEVPNIHQAFFKTLSLKLGQALQIHQATSFPLGFFSMLTTNHMSN